MLMADAIVQIPASDVVPGHCVRVHGRWTTIVECGQVGAYVELIAADNSGTTYAPAELVEIAEVEA